MSILTGKEALIALANGEVIEIRFNNTEGWHEVNKKDAYSFEIFLDERGTKFRLKPRTITINGIEAPAPFKPKAGEQAFYITAFGNYDALVFDWQLNDFGYWRTEDEIKQVIAALRQVFGGAQ